MTAHALELVRVGKVYRIGGRRTAYRTLREDIQSLWRRSDTQGGSPTHELWALREASFVVRHGESIGIVGANGAGKSTLLKILARITYPSAGYVRMQGTVSALLEIGTGFHPELTGRDNVYLNGAMLGMSRAWIRKQFDDIVDFAGVGRFLDTPLKQYSTGMRLRLAFGVAAYLDPDILLVDEVLAVGDATFRRRCVERLAKFAADGKTVLFVSHDLGAIHQTCARAIWLDRGSVREDGPVAPVIENYLASSVPNPRTRAEFSDVPSDVPAYLWRVALTGPQTGRPPRRAEPIRIDVTLQTQGLDPLDVAVYLLNQQGLRVLDEALSDYGLAITPTEGRMCRLSVTLPGVLAAGTYVLGIWLGSGSQEYFDGHVFPFTIDPLPDDTPEAVERRRVVQPLVKWELDPSGGEAG